jgi:hypothetical protein
LTFFDLENGDLTDIVLNQNQQIGDFFSKVKTHKNCSATKEYAAVHYTNKVSFLDLVNQDVKTYEYPETHILALMMISEKDAMLIYNQGSFTHFGILNFQNAQINSITKIPVVFGINPNELLKKLNDKISEAGFTYK